MHRVPAALVVSGAEQSQEEQEAASSFSISPQYHVSPPFARLPSSLRSPRELPRGRLGAAFAAQEHLWMLSSLPEGCRAGFDQLQEPSGDE